MDGVDVENAITRDRIRAALKRYENKPGDSFENGTVRTVNSDGSYEVLLDGDVQARTCSAYATAGVGDRVLVCIMANGRCVAIARLEGAEAEFKKPAKIPNLHITSTTDASGTADNDVALIVGNRSGAHISMDVNEINAKASGTTTAQLNLNADGGTVAVRGVPIYGAKVLYSNSTGTTGTVTLSESAANFTFLDIIFGNGEGRVSGTTRVYSPNGKTAEISANLIGANGYASLYFARYTISGTSMTKSLNNTLSASLNGTWSVSTTGELYVLAVLGWK